jgi:hypothetical protein
MILYLIIEKKISRPQLICNSTLAKETFGILRYTKKIISFYNDYKCFHIMDKINVLMSAREYKKFLEYKEADKIA